MFQTKSGQIPQPLPEAIKILFSEFEAFSIMIPYEHGQTDQRASTISKRKQRENK
jgi:hypothetical protein